MFELSLDFPTIGAITSLGLIAGVLGGLLGVGGSVIMIPGLTLLLGRHQHLYQAAAMIANVAVSLPAAGRHYRAGAMVPRALAWMLPAALVFVLLGVWGSNLSVFAGADGGIWLGRLLAVLLVYVIVLNVRRLVVPPVSGDGGEVPVSPGRATGVGTVMGATAGLLGVGGGSIAVPLQQVLLKLPLRACIANSSALICLSATLGAIYKNISLSQHGYGWGQSLTLALILAPTCVLGGHLGAALTHKLPIRQVRLAFIVLMIAAAVKMAAIPWQMLIG